MVRGVRIGWHFLLVLTLILAIAGCGTARLSDEPLPVVALIPPPPLPNWIEQISPIGEAETKAQIRIRFKEALIPVESMDSSQDILKKFELYPPLPGQFRFLTPRMVGWQGDRALPKATRVRITLKAGLTDLKNHRLDKDLAWTFSTEAIKLFNLPGIEPNSESSSEPLSLQPTLKFSSNVELNLDSLSKQAQLVAEEKKQSVPLKIALEKQEVIEEDNSAQEKFDLANRDWNYTIKPQQNLDKATRYRLEFARGLLPLHGNLPSTSTFATQVQTYAPLTFDKIQYIGQADAGGAYGRFVQGSPQLIFNNGLVAESAIANIKIQPAPKQSPRLIQAYEGNSVVNLNPYALEPATTYTVTLGADLKDKFGQTLDKSITQKFTTSDVSPDIWVPSDLNIFPDGKNLQLNISTVNLPESRYKAAYKVVQPEDLVYIDSAYPRGDGNDLLPSQSSWQKFPVKGRKNQSVDTTVPLREKLGNSTGMLAYGVQARTNSYKENGKQQWREPTFYGLVQLTNLGVFSQWFPDSGLIRVHHLSDGAAVANANVEIYESKLGAKSRIVPVACAVGKTDLTGTLLLNRQALQTCTGGAEFNTPPKLLVIAREGQDWTFTRNEEYSGSYGYGIDAGWNSSQIESRGTIFSDRQLYQPGEKAELTGAAYYLQNGVIKQDKNVSYQVTLENPNGEKIDLGTQTTNEFGTFSLEIPLNSSQPLGYYSIRAKGESGAEISGEFRVAEFKPPNFKVELDLGKEFVLSNDKIAATAQSNYLFGAPVEGGKAQYYVTRSQTNFNPQGWEQFSFGRQWFWPEESPNITSDVLRSRQVLDAAGKSSQIVPVAKDLPYPMTYRVDVQISDVSNLSVADSRTFTALPSDRLIGLQSDFVADAGKSFPIQVIVTDPTGKAVTGQQVRVELQEMKYSSVTQVVEGSQTPHNQVEYKTVAQTQTSSSDTPQTVYLTPPASGSYRIRANFTNAKDESTATDTQIWVTGDNGVNWGDRYKNNRLELKLDKDSYQPGETATVLIQSPYPEAELYLAVVRHDTLYRTIIPVKGGAPQIQFQVTADMLPNAAVEAVLVRQGTPISQVEPGSLENLVRIGFAPFKINLEDKYLKVQVNPEKRSLAPGEAQTVELQLQDGVGNFLQGQFAVMVVNEAVLQLSGYRLPDLVQIVYAEQPISTRFADNRPNVVLSPLSSPLDKGWGYGGGNSSGLASTRVRTNFQPLAYYNGAVQTDASGRAKVTFTLPDDLTTWRVMAVATDGDLRFGNGEETFIATKPLLSNPILPQFARIGDRFDAGLSVTNTTGQSGTLAIQGTVDGSIQFADNNSGDLSTPTKSGTSAYRFPFVATRAGKSTVKFTTQLNGTTDAFAVPLEVKPLEVTEQVVESGVTSDRTSIPLNIDNNVVPDVGGLEISLASTPIANITAPVKQVLDEEQLPFLEPAASQLAIAANLQILSQQYGQTVTNFNPSQQAKALERLQKLQLPDGGFASLPGDKTSDPFVSPYAASAIATAQTAGFDIDAKIVNRLRNYLQKLLANPSQYDFCKESPCKERVRLEAAIALAQLGNKQNDFLADIYHGRDRFDLVTKIKLARYLHLFPEWQQEAKILTDRLQEIVYETGRSAVVNLPSGWQWLNSPTTSQAQALRLFIDTKAKPEVLARLLQGLLALRREGTWQTTYDNAEALTALVQYMRVETLHVTSLQPTPPNFTANVQLGGKNLTATQFEGYRKPSVDISVPMTQLPRGQKNLNLTLKKSGRGMLHYLLAYRYRLQGEQPGRLNGLRITREIRPANETKALRRIGLYAPTEPLTVPVGQVFDIGLEIISDRPVDRVVITDPLPAGFEAVDTSFQTATPYFQPQQDSWEIGYQTIYRDRVVAYSDRLEPGVYQLHYLVRSVTPGTFLWSGAEAHLQYAPEEFGRCSSSRLVIQDSQ
ncbi:alpha-2-macroglobulin family protein [Chroococcidiopsis thermalis]|uniref:Alpha-2-macroglobulin domain protein n=1 Tax=Chroococcidiopsis thermalis (strain PCC 7203) TaxID=251229 RepID=K9TXI6_CHRTP|nr:alpha-2-macroglobulin [Chroococcidiopsis thermalis]AFY86891.1 alpha-2-macroglobulin domain protein [Chroococcidiopsis thermalis PCC 7203]